MNLWSKRFVASSGPALQGTVPLRSAFVPRAAQQAVGAEGKGASVIRPLVAHPLGPVAEVARHAEERGAGGEAFVYCFPNRHQFGPPWLDSSDSAVLGPVRDGGATQATRRSVRRAVERRPAGSWADVCWTEARFFPRRFRGAGRSSRASSPSDDDVAGWPAAVPPEWMQGSVFRRGRVREPVVIPASSARRLPPSAE